MNGHLPEHPSPEAKEVPQEGASVAYTFRGHPIKKGDTLIPRDNAAALEMGLQAIPYVGDGLWADDRYGLGSIPLVYLTDGPNRWLRLDHRWERVVAAEDGGAALKESFHGGAYMPVEGGGGIFTGEAQGTFKGDPVILPNHYTRYAIEPIRFIRENSLPFWMGNVVKYVLRADAKDGLQDLKKARRYLDMEIARQEGVEDWYA